MMIEKLSEVLKRENKKYEELQEKQSREKESQIKNNNKMTEREYHNMVRFLRNELVSYRTKLEQLCNEIMDDIREEMITEYGNNQTLALGYEESKDNSEKSN